MNLGWVLSPCKQLKACVPPGDAGSFLKAMEIRDWGLDKAKTNSYWISGSLGNKHGMFNRGLCSYYDQQHWQPIFSIFNTVQNMPAK